MPDKSISSLLIGVPVPDCELPDDTCLHALRGQPVVLAFAPDEWNPAAAYENELFARLLQEVGGASTDEPSARTWYSLDWRGEVAAQLGVAGQRCLLLLDEDGVLRWQVAVTAGQIVRPGEVLAALEALRPVSREPGEALTPITGLSRRTFLTATLAATALLLLAEGSAAAESAAPTGQPEQAPVAPIEPMAITLTINGQTQRLMVEPRVALLDALREQLHLTGTKKGCDHGQCGACTVHLDGQSALSCLTLAVMSQGKQITTIEGLAQGETLHPVQAAFIAHDAFQCGYCTPGQIMAATALLQDPRLRTGSAVEIREAMSGNLCRCAAYPNIIAAIQQVHNV